MFTFLIQTETIPCIVVCKDSKYSGFVLFSEGERNTGWEWRSETEKGWQQTKQDS